MAAVIIVKTNAAAGATTIKDLGVIIPTSGGEVSFTERAEQEALQNSEDLRAYLIDDVFGAGSSTLILNDGTSDIAQGDALDWLDTAVSGTGTPNIIDRSARDSASTGLIYIGRSENDPVDEGAAEWQIYRYDGEAAVFTSIFADGDTGFTHIWTNRESLTY